MADMVADMEVDMVVDMGAVIVANMDVDIVANMAADMVADMVADMEANKKKIGLHGVGHSITKCIGPKLFDADFALQSVSDLRVFASLLGMKKIK